MPTQDEQLDKILEHLRWMIAPDEDGHSQYETADEQAEAEREAVKKAKSTLQRMLVEAEINGWLMGFKASGEGFNGEYPYGDRNASDGEILQDILPPYLLEVFEQQLQPKQEEK